MPPDYGSCQPCESVGNTFSWSLTEEQETPLLRIQKTNYFIPKRYIFSILSFTACCLAVSYNINLSIAIISMVKHHVEYNHTTESNASQLRLEDVQDGQFHWSADIEGVALGAVYYGQLVSFIPGGRMAELYGGKKMLILCTLISSLATIMSPISAVWSPYVFIVVRILVGIGTGPIIPIVFFMLARWIPQAERSFHASFILSGYGVGSFLAVIVSGALCGTTFLNGWPSVFYTGGFFGILWCFVCAYMMSETPTRHPNISIEEISYILNGLETAKREKILRIPWKEMALSVPLWALAIGFFGQFWLLGFFSTVHALYMGTVLQLPMAKNGVLSCLPHLLRAFATCIASYPVDILLKRELVSVGFVRKGATIINTVVSCGAFLGITIVGRNVTATTLLFILGGVLGEFVTFGVCMACIDIAPSLSGTLQGRLLQATGSGFFGVICFQLFSRSRFKVLVLMWMQLIANRSTVSGIINIVGVFPFFMIPALVGYMTNYENSIEQWKKVFYVTISIVSVSTLLFVIFGDLKPQSWGIAPQSENKRKKKENVAESKDLTEPKHFLHSI